MIDAPLLTFLFNLAAARMTFVFALIPFYILTTFVGLERISKTTIDAARDFGVGRMCIYRRKAVKR